MHMICSGPGADQGLNTMDVAFRVREREIDRKATVTMSRQVGTGVHAVSSGKQVPKGGGEKEGGVTDRQKVTRC